MYASNSCGASNSRPASQMRKDPVPNLLEQLATIKREHALQSDVVQRLSEELALYQDRYGLICADDAVKRRPKNIDDRSESETVDDIAQPLFDVYDKRIAELTDRLTAYERSAAQFAKKLEGVVAENQQLRRDLMSARAIQAEASDVADLREHLSLLVQENQLLLEQQTATAVARDAEQTLVKQHERELRALAEKVVKLQEDKSLADLDALAVHQELALSRRELAQHRMREQSEMSNEASWALAMTNRPSPAATLLQQLSASHGSATSTSAATATISRLAAQNKVLEQALLESEQRFTQAKTHLAHAVQVIETIQKQSSSNNSDAHDFQNSNSRSSSRNNGASSSSRQGSARSAQRRTD